MKFAQKEKAIKMRENGKSYSEILREIKVSRSSLSRWLQDVVLSDVQKSRILHGLEISRDAAAKAKRLKRITITNQIIEEGKKEFSKRISNPLFLSGILLYWAEGDKSQERVKFTNSDENMIRFMMKWFRKECNVPESKFRIALHVHDLESNIDPVNYWSNITGVDKKQFQKVYIKESTLRQRRNVLYNGTCAIVISDKRLFRKIRGWRLGLLEYFGMTAPVV